MSTVSQNSIQGTSVSLKYSNFGVGTLLLIIINVCRESTSEQKEKDQELKENDNKATDVTVYYAQCKNNTLCENELYYGKKAITTKRSMPYTVKK